MATDQGSEGCQGKGQSLSHRRPLNVENAKGSPTIPVLVIDDDEQTLALIEAALEQQSVTILRSTDPEKGLELFLQHRPEVVLVDLKMPKMSGLELLERFLSHDPGTEVILMTGQYSPSSAVEAIKKGAADYLTKPLEMDILRQRIGVLVEEAQKRRRVTELDRELLETFQFESIVGRSPLMLDVFGAVRRVAPHFRTVLVTGATGTGKEQIARALHRLGPTGTRTFAACNCSALTETLYESELFGYVRGAFTGATQDKMGLFEYANGGTVFLDEIGDLSLSGQAKLLRVLQNHEIQRVGSPAVRRVDVRVIAATNRDLRAMVAERKFREDLFYRISMVEIGLPKLLERMEDLPLLQRHFVDRFSREYKKEIRGLTRQAQKILTRHTWPGNVRELENVIGNACMMVQGQVIDVADLPAYLRVRSFGSATWDDEVLSIDELTFHHVLKVIRQFKGRKTQAAEALGIGRTTLYNLLKKHNMLHEMDIEDTA